MGQYVLLTTLAKNHRLGFVMVAQNCQREAGGRIRKREIGESRFAAENSKFEIRRPQVQNRRPELPDACREERQRRKSLLARWRISGLPGTARLTRGTANSHKNQGGAQTQDPNLERPRSTSWNVARPSISLKMKGLLRTQANHRSSRKQTACRRNGLGAGPSQHLRVPPMRARILAVLSAPMLRCIIWRCAG